MVVALGPETSVTSEIFRIKDRIFCELSKGSKDTLLSNVTGLIYSKNMLYLFILIINTKNGISENTKSRENLKTFIDNKKFFQALV